MSKARLLAKGSALGIVEFFYVAFVTLAMTPFIIRSLGDNMYGLWIFVGSFLGYYGLIDLGLTSAIQRFLSRAIGSSCKDEQNKIINTALAIFFVLACIVLAFSFLIAFGLPAILKNITYVSLFRKIIIILGLNYAMKFSFGLFTGILAANLRHDLNTFIYLVKFTVSTILIIVFLKKGYGIMSLALITFFTDIAGHAIHFFAVKRLYPYIIFSFKLASKSLIRPLFGYSIYSFMSRIANQLRFNIDNLVITAFLGLSAVTLYSIASRLINYFMHFMVSSLGLFKPLFSYYEGSRDYISIREKFLLATKISSYVAILIGSLIIIFGNVFIEAWVGKEYLGAYSILLILVLPITFVGMQSTSPQLLFGISKHKFLALISFMEGIANLVLSLILVRKYGLIGIALGTAIPMSIVSLFIMPAYVCKVIDLDIRKYYLKAIFFPLLIAGLLLSFFWLLTKNVIHASFLNIFIIIAGIIILFVPYVFFAGFSLTERKYFKGVFLNG